MKSPPELPAEATYNEQERAAIRRRLLAYCKSHGIGVPTLQKRIAEFIFGNEYSDDRVGQKTLQRFLSNDKANTQLLMVWMCHRFTAVIDAEDPVRAFGHDLCGYFQHNEDPKSLLPLAGAYRGKVPKDVEDDPAPDPFADVGAVRLTLSAVAGAPFLGAELRHEGSSSLSEGVALCNEDRITVWLRSSLTHEPETLLLSTTPDISGWKGTLLYVPFDPAGKTRDQLAESFDFQPLGSAG